MVLTKTRLLLSVVSLLWFLASCAPTLVGPIEPNSSLVIGRVVVNNKFPGAFHGLLPLGIIEKGLEIEIESRDGSQSFKVNTEEQGYFFMPNISPNTYHILRVMIEGGRSTGDRERYGLTLRRPTFTPVPGKITYFGTLFVDLSDKGTSKVRETREDETAKAYFLQKYSASPWAPREFVSVGPKSTPAVQLAEEKKPRVATKGSVESATKAERPDWKVGYVWRFAWKQPGTSGTLTREIVKEDAFEGVPAYVMRAGKNDYFYNKDLGLLAEMFGGKLISKRTPAYLNFSWPFEVGQEWKNTFLRDNVQQQSSQTFDIRMMVARIENVKVPAGVFDAYKIEAYHAHTGSLLAEYWYSPTVKWFIKLRFYRQNGLREEELISFKVD